MKTSFLLSYTQHARVVSNTQEVRQRLVVAPALRAPRARRHRPSKLTIQARRDDGTAPPYLVNSCTPTASVIYVNYNYNENSKIT